MMERMILLSSIFRSKKSLSKEVKQMKEESCSETSKRFQEKEEDPCTSYSHRGSEEKEYHLEHEILCVYLEEYKCQPRAFRETLDLPQFIQLKEERRPYRNRMVKGNKFILSTFDGSPICKERVW